MTKTVPEKAKTATTNEKTKTIAKTKNTTNNEKVEKDNKDKIAPKKA
jgi:hypothetical protein